MATPLDSAHPQAIERPPVAPGALPVVGHLIEYLREPQKFLVRAASSGRATRLLLGIGEAVLLRDPEDIERVFLTEHRSFRKDEPTRALTRLLGDGLLTSEGDTWLRHRRLIAPAFHRERIAVYAADMVSATERFVLRIRHGEEQNLHQAMLGLTLDIVTRALFDSDVSGRAAEISSAIDVLTKRFGQPWFLIFPWLENLPLPGNSRIKRAFVTLDDVLLGMIHEKRQRGPGGSDLLSMLLATQDDAGKGLSDREVRDEVMTLFIAGHETTALALTFAFVLLARSPSVEKRLRDEIQSLGDAPLTADDISRLPYTRAVVLETMRIYPPAWAVGREAIADVTVADYLVRKGDQVWAAQWANHRDPRYFPDPDRFNPERWLDGLERSLPRFAYFPFGGGPRICIGNGFAMMELILVLATIIRKSRVRLIDDKPLALTPLITLRPSRPIPAAFERVSPSQDRLS